jgi:hypothetical protein
MGVLMDKLEAIKRLDALDAEAKKLREIIEHDDTLEFDKCKLYVAIIADQPHLLVGNGNYFWWHRFIEHNPVTSRWSEHQTAQIAIKRAATVGKVYAFTDCFEGMKFFYDAYMADKND